MNQATNSMGVEAHPSVHGGAARRMSFSPWQRWPVLLLTLAGCPARDADFSAVNTQATVASDSAGVENAADSGKAQIDTLEPALDEATDWGKNPFLSSVPPKMPQMNATDSSRGARSETASLSVAQSRRWNLNGILARNGMWIAIINGKILASGGKIDGYQLIAIDRDSATLAKNDDTIVLRLK